MRFSLDARTKLASDLARLRHEHVVAVELSELVDLVREPDPSTFGVRRGPEQAGVDDLAATLAAARRLPDDLTVRVALPRGAASEPSAAEVEGALHRRAAYLATVAWRDGMAQRAMGLSQLPLGLLVSAVSWAAAYLFGYLATEVDGVGVGLFAVSAMVAITIAWVVSWMVIEATVLDWRAGASRGAAYDLLARARLELVTADSSRSHEA